MTPQERIKADAERYTKDEGYQKAYIAGATAEAERAQRLVEALEVIADSNCDYESTNYAKAIHKPDCRACNAKQAIAEWKGAGKEVNKRLHSGNKHQWQDDWDMDEQGELNEESDRPCPHCGKELNRDRNLCCRGKEVAG